MAVRVRLQRQAKRFQEMRSLKDDGKIRGGEVYINVTALVDMMTVLVIFLVMQFNASGEMLFISKDLTMARSQHGLILERVPIVSVSRSGEVYFEGVRLVEALQAPKDAEDWRIPQLAEKLDDNRKRFLAISSERQAVDPQQKVDPSTSVNLQIDENVDYALIKRVMATCESVGYSNMRLATFEAGKSAK